MRLAYLYCVCSYKVYPIIGHEGPEVKQRYSSTLSLTTAVDGDGWLKPPSSHFNPQERDVVHILTCMFK
jgi:hypothetical protein